jgi:hypothetical protein
VTADALDPVDRLLAERECERLIIDFVRRLDLGEPGSVAELTCDFDLVIGQSSDMPGQGN